MPIYRYKCLECSYKFRRILDEIKDFQECPECGEKATLCIPKSSFSIRYQGKGFYATKNSSGEDSER